VGADVERRDAWTDPGTFEVAPGVHRIPLPLPQDGLRAVNVYAIVTDDDLVLVDGGWALDAARRQLEESLATIDRKVGDISRFLVTHAHRDHYTQAVAVRREFGTHVAIGVGERPSLESLSSPAAISLTGQFRVLETCGAQPLLDRLRAAGFSKPIPSDHWELPDEWIEDRARVALDQRHLTAVHTPGHTRGHLVFVDEADGLLFAGDHVLPHITPSIGFEKVPGSLPLDNYLVSLAKVRAMPDLRLLPAHGPVTDSVHARVDELLAHHDARLTATRAAVEAGSGTAYETARALTWTRRERRFDDLDPFNQMLATMETAAHLDVLVARGRLSESVGDDGVTVYALA
jgi:glyoxylase-like metal-dependent hydrolase (beta-lactamase superfamily II)